VQAFERLGLFIMSNQLLMDPKCEGLVDVTEEARQWEEEV